MVGASCSECGWRRAYAHRQGAHVGLLRHRERDCGPEQRGGNSPARQATLDERGGRRWRDLTHRAGIPADRTDAEWVAHPYALDDLLRVLGGTRLEVIAQERRKMREAS